MIRRLWHYLTGVEHIEPLSTDEIAEKLHPRDPSVDVSPQRPPEYKSIPDWDGETDPF